VHGYIAPEAFNDAEIRDFISKACENKDTITSEELFVESFRLFSDNSEKTAILKVGVYTSIKQQPIKWLKGYYNRLKKVLQNCIFKSKIIRITILFSVFGFNFHMLLLLLLFYFLFIVNSLRKGGWPIVSFIIFIVPTLFFLMISVGAQSEWGRLFLPATPCVLLIIGHLIDEEILIRKKIITVKNGINC
jgi:hypothetical protein